MLSSKMTHEKTMDLLTFSSFTFIDHLISLCFRQSKMEIYLVDIPQPHYAFQFQLLSLGVLFLPLDLNHLRYLNLINLSHCLMNQYIRILVSKFQSDSNQHPI